MTIRKTGSRCIVIDGAPYRWRIRRRPTYQSACGGLLSFCVQHADGGSVLLVQAGGSRLDNFLKKPGIVVTPRDITKAVRLALESGWRPLEDKSSFELTIGNES